MMPSLFSLRLRLLLAAALVACSGSLLTAQTPTALSQDTEASGLSIKKTVRRVVVDVVVTDSDQKPVRGLTTQDFSVHEDGTAQKILSFDVHDLESASESAKLAPLPPNTFVNIPTAPERGPLYVLLLDLVHMQPDDQPIARRQLLEFIGNKPAGTRFAIFVLSDGLHMIQGFTDDRNQLVAAVDPNGPGHHIPRIFLYGDNYRSYTSPLGILLDIARFLDGLPGRKNVIWLSGSFPATIFPSSDRSAEAVSYSEYLKKATDAMARGQIAVYPVDIRGVVVTAAPKTKGIKSGVSTASAPTDEGDYGGPANADPTTSDLNGGYLTEDEIARATGGRAFYSTNDFKGALAEATAHGANYYTLTYSPSNQNYEGTLRNIRVRLSKRGYHLAYRRSYYGEDTESPDRPVTSSLGDSLYANMKHGAPIAHQLYLRAHVHAVGLPAKATPEQMANLVGQSASLQGHRGTKTAKPAPPIKLQTYAIDYIVAVRQPNASIAGSEPSTLEFASEVFDADGKMLNGAIQRAVETTSPAALAAKQEGIYRIRQQIDAPLDAASIRVAVREASTDRIGAMEIPLPLAPELQAEVPDAAPIKAN
ncbi:MAG TPA: VWA domain-containing protein [Terriglobales bacterium]|jgi:VWFA-related protein|nr:VWA domain-containing protein [Terriglobales bacterium]